MVRLIKHDRQFKRQVLTNLQLLSNDALVLIIPAFIAVILTVRGNSLEGLISNESPLGKALLGKKVGDIVHVQVNANVGYDVEIKALKNTEDDGDKIRSF